MRASLPLDQMSVEEKIRTMEAIWDDLCHHATPIGSPEWHGSLLAERESELAGGKDAFIDWETAKEAIRREVL